MDRSRPRRRAKAWSGAGSPARSPSRPRRATARSADRSGTPGRLGRTPSVLRRAAGAARRVRLAVARSEQRRAWWAPGAEPSSGEGEALPAPHRRSEAELTPRRSEAEARPRAEVGEVPRAG